MVPGAIPLTVPLVAPIVATPGVLLVQVPPPGLERVEFVPTQIPVAPVMALTPLTLTVRVARQAPMA